jgi:selenide,water dikinase
MVTALEGGMKPVLTEPAVKDLVLVGGGHTHLTVLKRFGMHPVRGLRLTLVSRTSQSPYSGMLPGYIAGHYTREQMHFDLWALCRFAGARFVHAEVDGLDPGARQLHLKDRPALEFDFLSINTGATPTLPDAPGVPAWLTPVKPIDAFSPRFDALLARVAARHKPSRIGVVGGGAGGVELLLAVRHRLHRLFAEIGRAPAELSFHLITAGADVLESHNARTRARFHTEFQRQGVITHTGMRIISFEGEHLTAADGRSIALDEVLWVTQAAPAPWFRQSGLAVDEGGFLRVGLDLQVENAPNIFAAGDCAAVRDHPRPKAGVYAVRQGPLLADNLYRAVMGKRLRRTAPQTKALSLIATGPRQAVASRGRWCFSGAWVWRWKDFIDRRFMQAFQTLPVMPAAVRRRASGTLASELASVGADEPRCGGCGAKVAANVLAAALPMIPTAAGPLRHDDAAVTRTPEGQVAVHSIDGFRSFVGDPFVFGAIAAAHALSDLYAVGARPHSALAYLTLPLNGEALMRRDLTQLMAGILSVLERDGATLIGGHTAESAELSAALAVQGHAEPARLWHKDTPQAGDALILTRPLGTGILLAGLMQGAVPGRAIDPLLASLP